GRKADHENRTACLPALINRSALLHATDYRRRVSAAVWHRPFSPSRTGKRSSGALSPGDGSGSAGHAPFRHHPEDPDYRGDSSLRRRWKRVKLPEGEKMGVDQPGRDRKETGRGRITKGAKAGIVISPYLCRLLAR